MCIALAQVLIFSSILLVDNIGFYLNVFYVNGGDTQYGAFLKGISGTLFQAGGLMFIPLIFRLSKRIGKQRAFMICTASIVVGGVAKWFCYTPGAGWWMVLPSFLLAPGLVAVMMLVPSMTADVCDLDEVRTNARREGMYNAVANWMLKLSNSVTVFCSGFLLSAVGWKTDLGAGQSPGTFLAMRITFCFGTIALAVLASLVLRNYRVTEAMVRAARVEAGHVPT